MMSEEAEVPHEQVDQPTGAPVQEEYHEEEENNELDEIDETQAVAEIEASKNVKDEVDKVDEYSDADDDVDALDYQDLGKLKARKRSTAPGSSSQSPAKQRSVEPMNYPEENDVVSYSQHQSDSSIKRRQELEERLERALKKPKMKKRKGEDDLTNDEDELIQILKNQMDQSAKQDAELIENASGIAMNKIQLLPKVRDIISKVNLAEVILDNNLLAEVRQWLEPLPDASLPSYEIQKTLFAALLKLPINTNHLRESGIGKILLFYQKSKRVEPKIKRIADKLISDWTRPIIGASDNYRDKQFQLIDYDAMKHRQKLKSTASKIHIDNSEKTIYEQQAARRNRAAAPAPTITDYKFVPKSRVDRTPQSIINAGVGTSLNRDDQFKRINNRLAGRGRKTGAKKGGVSIEGRGMKL